MSADLAALSTLPSFPYKVLSHPGTKMCPWEAVRVWQGPQPRAIGVLGSPSQKHMFWCKGEEALATAEWRTGQ